MHPWLRHSRHAVSARQNFLTSRWEEAGGRRERMLVVPSVKMPVSAGGGCVHGPSETRNSAAAFIYGRIWRWQFVGQSHVEIVWCQACMPPTSGRWWKARSSEWKNNTTETLEWKSSLRVKGGVGLGRKTGVGGGWRKSHQKMNGTARGQKSKEHTTCDRLECLFACWFTRHNVEDNAECQHPLCKLADTRTCLNNSSPLPSPLSLRFHSFTFIIFLTFSGRLRCSLFRHHFTFTLPILVFVLFLL